MTRLVALLAACSLAACSAGDAAPQEEGRIRDYAEILDPATEVQLAERLDRAEALYGPQVGIVTIESLEGRPIEEFSLDYAREWRLGNEDRDDGILVIVAPNERKVRIEVGYGLEASFSDVFAQEIIDQVMLPRFRQEDYARGLAGAVDMMIAKMRAVPSIPANDNAPVRVDEAA